MRWLRCESRRLSLGAGIPCFVVLGLALTAGGCASSAADQAVNAQGIAPIQRVEMEADGLPPQVPPPVGMRRQPDDPSEPFSPNYGAPPASRPAPARMSAADEDAIIARAIVAHEMRRP
jgi:hypothetical protein